MLEKIKFIWFLNKYKIQGILGLKKIGHGGTLDPRVTGVLPLALENYTKAMKLFLESNNRIVSSGE